MQNSRNDNHTNVIFCSCRWHEAWAEANVSEAQSRYVEDWFMGRCEGLVPNNTRRVTKADPDTTPYRTLHKYKNFKQMK